MTATYEQAIDDIFTMFKTAWDTTGYIVIYENTTPSEKPSIGTPYAKVFIRHTGGFQATLTGGIGTARYARLGVMTVQIFTPLGEGLSEGASLAKVLADAYEGAASPRAVWFRNVRLMEVGPTAEWFQHNFLVDFEYDEVK